MDFLLSSKHELNRIKKMDKKIADKTTLQKSSSGFESIKETDKLLKVGIGI